MEGSNGPISPLTFALTLLPHQRAKRPASNKATWLFITKAIIVAVPAGRVAFMKNKISVCERLRGVQSESPFRGYNGGMPAQTWTPTSRYVIHTKEKSNMSSKLTKLVLVI